MMPDRANLMPVVSPTPLISYVVASYNDPLRLAACLESIRHQIYGHFEVVVTDDGSDDPAVPGLVGAYNVTFITRVHDSKDGIPTRNMPEVLNKGVAAAKGDIVQTLQQDHILAPDFGLWLARCWNPQLVVFGLTDRTEQGFGPADLDAMLRTLHLPDGEVRYEQFVHEGRACLLEFTDWRHTDGLDAAIARDLWSPIDQEMVGSGHMWLDHMIQAKVRGLRFVINPFMRLWHWEHPGRDGGDWRGEIDASDQYMRKKWGEGVWAGWVAGPLWSYRKMRREAQEFFHV